MRFRRGTIDGGSNRRFGKTGSATATLDGSRLVQRLNGLVVRLLLLFSSVWKNLRTIPLEERSRAVSFVFGGLSVGSVAGLLLAPSLIQNFGWESVFYLFGLLGIAWFLGFQFLEEGKPSATMSFCRAESFCGLSLVDFLWINIKELLSCGHAKSSGGVNLLYIVLVGLIGILMGYFMRKS